MARQRDDFDDDDEDDRPRRRPRRRYDGDDIVDDEDSDDRPRRRERPDIPNYLVQSIAVTFCCCLPLGIVAIVNAAQVNSLVSAGDYRAARAASDAANKWGWIGFGVGLVVNIVAFAVQFMAGMAAQQQGR